MPTLLEKELREEKIYSVALKNHKKETMNFENIIRIPLKSQQETKSFENIIRNPLKLSIIYKENN